jgi:5-methylcytosine-specific restriction endonuclease McrA
MNLNQLTVLVLNKNWQAIHVKNPMDALSMMYTGTAVALHVIDGEIQQPLKWNQWVSLPFNSNEQYLNSPTQQIQIPKIIILTKFGKVPLKRPKLSKQNIWKRDNFTCQYTGKKIKLGEGNIDHVLPKSKGGKTEWSNLVLSCKDINQHKGDKTPEQAGLKLIKSPVIPSVGLSTDIIENKFNIREWDLFLTQKNKLK